MGHKKSNDRLQAQRALDDAKWEAAKEVGREGQPVQVGRMTAPDEHVTGQGRLKAAVDRLEESIARESARKTEETLKGRSDHERR